MAEKKNRTEYSSINKVYNVEHLTEKEVLTKTSKQYKAISKLLDHF
jgi:hypothetical protein